MGGGHAALRTSTVIEDYLVTIYRLAVGGDAVLGARLAEQLAVSPASVTEMVGRLRQQGLLEPGRRIVLSPAGLAMARTLVTRQTSGCFPTPAVTTTTSATGALSAAAQPAANAPTTTLPNTAARAAAGSAVGVLAGGAMVGAVARRRRRRRPPPA